MLYEILRDTTTESLERRVAEAIGFGWLPQGGVSIAFMGGAFHVAQAMVQDDDERPLPELRL